MKTFTSRYAGSKLLQSFTPVQSLSFSARGFATKKPEFNVLFFCPRNEEHFRSFDTEYPDFIKSTSPKSISVTDIAHKPQNNSAAISSLLSNNVSPSIIIPHLVLIGHSKEEADKKIRFFHDSGIESVLVVRGNPATVQKDLSYTHHPQGYEDMPQLMRRVKELSPNMKIVVAGYPEKHPFDVNAERGLDELEKKVDNGADMIITQHFFDNRYFLEFMEGCQRRGIILPIIPSVLPIGNPKYLFSFSKAAGIAPPAEVTQILFGQEGMTTNSETIENKSVRRKAIEYTANHIKSLVDLDLPQVDRINTYAANNIPFLTEVLEQVGVTKYRSEDKGRS